MKATVTITRVADGVSVTYSTSAAEVSEWGNCDCMRAGMFHVVRDAIDDDSDCTVGEFTVHVVREDGAVIYSDAKGAA